MSDVVLPEKRSQMMSGIKGKNTRPEIIVRKALHLRGFRYRLHQKDLAGKPDLALRKYMTAIFVHGCFWHGHECRLFKWPKSNVDFWKNKIEGNCERDARQMTQLRDRGWRVIVVWECALRGVSENTRRKLFDRIGFEIKNPDYRALIFHPE
jgi:DNA mismatch endonuclease (patch repair protein)